VVAFGPSTRREFEQRKERRTMRLSEWGAAAPTREAAGSKVLAAAEAALRSLGATPDPDCWISWGDDPGVRWALLAPTPAGLVTANIRVNIPQEGPRAAGKLVRWSRVQLGEVAVEVQGAHRIISATLEGVILRGADADADAIGAFLQVVFAAIDGRPVPADGRPVPAGAAPPAAAPGT
jgi:hypothetical protein